MKLSTERVLTTHVGSLPRSQAVVDMLVQREAGGIGFVRTEFERVMDGAVAAVVRRQRDVGIDIVSDGETAKIGYATYIKDRLTGFDGEAMRVEYEAIVAGGLLLQLDCPPPSVSRLPTRGTRTNGPSGRAPACRRWRSGSSSLRL